MTKEKDREFAKNLFALKKNDASQTDGETPKIATDVLIFDETGTPEFDTHDNPVFGVGATTTRDKEAFGDISERMRDRLGKNEVKNRKSSAETKKDMAAEISNVDHEIVLVYIDKKATGNPRWWKRDRKRSAVQKKALQIAAEEVMSGEGNDYEIVIDYNTAYEPNEACNIVKKVARKKGKNVVSCIQDDSEFGENKNLLQTNDFLLGEAGRSARKGKKNESLNMRLERITKR